MRNASNNNFLILGDFNTKTKEIGANSLTDDNAQLFKNLTKNTNRICLNSMYKVTEPSFFGKQDVSTVDDGIADIQSKNKILAWKIHSELDTLSDHTLTTVKIKHSVHAETFSEIKRHLKKQTLRTKKLINILGVFKRDWNRWNSYKRVKNL